MCLLHDFCAASLPRSNRLATSCRPDDIVPLARHLADRPARRPGAELRLTPDAEAQLRDYRWPGNVRELAEVIERAARRRKRDEIGVEALQLPRA